MAESNFGFETGDLLTHFSIISELGLNVFSELTSVCISTLVR